MHPNAHTFTHRHQQELEELRRSVEIRVLEMEEGVAMEHKREACYID